MEFRKLAASHISARSVCCVAVALTLVFAATAVQAAPLTSSPPGFLAPVPQEPDPLGSAVQVAQTSLPFTGTGFSGVLVSTVYRRPNDGDRLTFTYQLQNNANSANVLHRLTVSSFAGFTTDASRPPDPLAANTIPPTLVDRSTPDVVGFSFLDGFGAGPVRPGQQSSLLVVETDALTHTASTASVIDGTTATVGTFAPLPAIPEPATWALGIIGMASLIGIVRKKVRS
jgi:hypothetical protein